jgi:hypothetical protein
MADETVGTLPTEDAASNALDDPADETSTDQAAPVKKKIPWMSWITAARQNRARLLDSHWRTNVDYRVQKPFGGIGDSDQTQDRIAVPEDWSRTKQKTAQLSFNTPKVVAEATRPEWQGIEDVVTTAVNDVLTKQCKASYMLDEVLADVINASGLMASVIGIEVRTEQFPVPGPPVPGPPISVPHPTVPGQTLAMPGPPVPGPAVPTQRKTYQRITWERISTASLLWPSEFTGSNWEEASWLAYESYPTLESAKKRWPGKLDDVEPKTTRPKLLAANVDDQTLQNKESSETVKATTIWYYTERYDPTVHHPEHISKCVYVEGVDDPVEDGPTDWQEWVPEILPTPGTAAVPPTPPGADPVTGQPTPGNPGSPAVPPKPGVPGHFIGIRSLPVRVGTLVYVSDLATPPSDSQAARPQVRELIRSRSQMLRQRDHSIPIRWFDTNRLDPEVADKLRLGEWQDMIPVNGPGDRVIGEVARASYPRENFQFQQTISEDLDRTWALASNQIASPTATTRSKYELQTIETASQIRLEYEKERVNRYVAEGAAVIWGLMQLFFDQAMYVEIVGEDGATELVTLDAAHRAADFTFSYLTDSSERIDKGARFQNLLKMYNLMANSPNTRRIEIEKELWRLSGFDPQRFVVPKPPSPMPDKPNVSYRFGGADLVNPLAVAVMLATGIQISPDEITAAALMIRDATQKMSGVQALPPPPGPGAGSSLPPPPGTAPVTPPEIQEPILKRTVSGEHL